MRIIQINIPDSVEMSDYDFSMMVAAKLYEDRKLSSGQAAEIVGLSKMLNRKCLENTEFQFSAHQSKTYIQT